MKNKGLSNNPKTRKLVANRMMNTRSYMSALAEKESLIRERPFSFQGNKTDMTKYNQFQKSAQTGVPQTDSKLNKTFANYGSKFNRLSGAMEKDQIANKLKKFKTMGTLLLVKKYYQDKLMLQLQDGRQLMFYLQSLQLYKYKLLQ